MPYRKQILLLFFLLPYTLLYAHPHMMLTNRCTVHGTEGKLKGITLEWELDKFFSADIRYNFDTDQNGVYNEEETAFVFRNAFSNLKKYNYFVFFRQGDTRESPEVVENFQVRNGKDGTVIYSFFIPLENYKNKELNIAVYDYSFFCHVLHEEEYPVVLDFSGGEVPTYRLQENRDYPVYYDPFAPATDLTLHTKWRPGLETFYPVEIQIALP